MEFPITLQDISVRYRLPKERIHTFKEFVIKSLKGKGHIEYEEFWALKNISFQLSFTFIFVFHFLILNKDTVTAKLCAGLLNILF